MVLQLSLVHINVANLAPWFSAIFENCIVSLGLIASANYHVSAPGKEAKDIGRQRHRYDLHSLIECGWNKNKIVP